MYFLYAFLTDNLYFLQWNYPWQIWTNFAAFHLKSSVILTPEEQKCKIMLKIDVKTKQKCAFSNLVEKIMRFWCEATLKLDSPIKILSKGAK